MRTIRALLAGTGPLKPALFAALGGLAALATAAQARDSLGMFGTWGAFRDPGVPRCYAVAMAEPAAAERATAERERQPYVAIGSWPARAERNQFHARLSRQTSPGARAMLAIGGAHFTLSGSGSEAWSQNRQMDAAIVAAMRSARSMRISSRDTKGRPFVDVYALAGAATAMDAATLACARG